MSIYEIWKTHPETGPYQYVEEFNNLESALLTFKDYGLSEHWACICRTGGAVVFGADYDSVWEPPE